MRGGESKPLNLGFRAYLGARTASPVDHERGDLRHWGGVVFVDLLDAEGKAELGFLESHVGREQACVMENGCSGRGAPDWEDAPNSHVPADPCADQLWSSVTGVACGLLLASIPCLCAVQQ